MREKDEINGHCILFLTQNTGDSRQCIVENGSVSWMVTRRALKCHNINQPSLTKHEQDNVKMENVENLTKIALKPKEKVWLWQL